MSKVAKTKRRGEKRGVTRQDVGVASSDLVQPAAARDAARRKVQRRRQIDPTTCEREYSPDELEFMRAMDQYKRTSGRMFPTCSEILEVLRTLGYERRGAEVVANAV